MSTSKSRIDRAATLADEARRMLEDGDGDTAAGLVQAARSAARAQWELDECRSIDGALYRLTAAAVETVATAVEDRARELDGTD